jgi:hypothetical protein
MIVPEALIKLFNFMVDESSTKSIDSEITRMCAFRFHFFRCDLRFMSVSPLYVGHLGGVTGIVLPMFLML